MSTLSKSPFSRGSKSVISALRALQSRISTLTRENEILSHKLNSTNIRTKSKLAETEIRYQEQREEARKIRRQNEECVHLLKMNSQRVNKDGMRISSLRTENETLASRINATVDEFEQYKLRSETRIATLMTELTSSQQKIDFLRRQAEARVAKKAIDWSPESSSPIVNKKVKRKKRTKKRKSKKRLALMNRASTTMARKQCVDKNVLREKKQRRRKIKKKSSKSNEVEKLLSPLMERKQFLEEVIVSLEVEFNDLQNRYSKMMQENSESSGEIPKEATDLILALESKQEQIRKLKHYRVCVLSELKKSKSRI